MARDRTGRWLGSSGRSNQERPVRDCRIEAFPRHEGQEVLTTVTSQGATARRTHTRALPMNSAGVDELKALILNTFEDAKAEDTVVVDLQGKSSLADAMVIASGRSDRHVSAIAERLLSALKDAGYGKARVEGQQTADWILVDAGDIIVHIFRPEVRSFYNLEKMWSTELPEDRLVV